MNSTQSTTARAGSVLNKSLPEARHAFVENGAIRLLQFGRIETVTPWEAIYALMTVDGSPYPESQERARQIRAALKETMQ